MKILSIILCFSCLIPLTSVIGQPVITDTAVLDQESTTNLLASNAGFAVANNYSIAQTFTAGMAGTLSSVNVAVWKGSSTTANLTMSIWSTGTSRLSPRRVGFQHGCSFDNPARGPAGGSDFQRFLASCNSEAGFDAGHTAGLACAQCPSVPDAL
jgi:hypothetical protein